MKFCCAATKLYFLGQSIHLIGLKDLLPLYDNIIFVSFINVTPVKDILNTYLKEFHDLLLKINNADFCMLGKMLQEIN